MPWFTQDAIEFFRELEFNNNKEWFEANKKRYEASVKRPMEAFAEEMIPRMKTIDPAIDTTGKKCVFRIYRDTRFSNNKTPYKTNAGLHVNSRDKGDLSKPGLYFHLDARSMGIASGCYMLQPDQIKKLRIYLSENLDEFTKQLEDKDFKKHFGTIKGEVNKVLPAELKPAAAVQPLIFNKQFYYYAEQDAEEALRDDLSDLVMAHMHACRGMNAFLEKGFA